MIYKVSLFKINYLENYKPPEHEYINKLEDRIKNGNKKDLTIYNKYITIKDKIESLEESKLLMKKDFYYSSEILSKLKCTLGEEFLKEVDKNNQYPTPYSNIGGTWFKNNTELVLLKLTNLIWDTKKNNSSLKKKYSNILIRHKKVIDEYYDVYRFPMNNIPINQEEQLTNFLNKYYQDGYKLIESQPLFRVVGDYCLPSSNTSGPGYSSAPLYGYYFIFEKYQIDN